MSGRNIYNLDFLDEYINWLCLKGSENKIISQWLKTQFRKWMINDFPSVEVVKNIKYDDPQWVINAYNNDIELYKFDNMLIHDATDIIFKIFDYLNHLTDKEFNKIYKIPFKQMLKNVKKWIEYQEKIKKSYANLNQCKIIHTYDDNFMWIEITGEKELIRESVLMNHCVDKYYQQIKNNKIKIFSLRNDKHKSHITVEYNINDCSIIQFKGKNNHKIKEKYIDKVLHLINQQLIDIKSIHIEDIKLNQLENLIDINLVKYI